MAKTNQTDIQLRIVAAIDGLVEITKLINEVDKLGGQTTESSAEVDKLVTELDSLRQQDQLISQFQQLKKSTADLSNTLDEARTRATALGKGVSDSKSAIASTNAEYKASKTNTQQLANEWQQAKAKVDLLAAGIRNSTAPTREQRDELKQAREEAKQFGTQYRASASETASLEKALSKLDSGLTKQTKEFNSARKEVNQLDAQYQKQNATLNSLRTTLQQTGVSTTQLVSEQVKLKSATAQAEIGVENLSASLREQAALHKYLKENVDLSGSAFKQNAVESKKLAASHAEASVASTGFASNISGLTSRLLAMAGAYVGINTITSAIKEMFSLGNQAELLQIQMNAVMGSIQAGEQATAWIQKFAKDTPLQLNEVTQAFTTMKSFGLDPMDGSLQAVVDQSYKLGKGFEGVQRISLALGQAWAKQKLQGEEIMQLVEAGVPVWDLLAKATGKNTYELQRLSEQGDLGRKVIKQLMDEIGSGAAGAAAANMGTLSGSISNAKDNLDAFYRKVADSGAMDWLKTQLSNLNAEFDKMSKDGRLTEYAKQVSDYLVTTAESVKGFVLNIAGSFDGVINATNVTFQSLLIVFNTFTLAIKSAVTIAMVPLVGFAKMLDGIAYAAEAIGLDTLASKLRFASGAIKAEFDAFAAAAKEDMNDIADASSKLSVDHKDATDAMKKSMQGVSDKSDATSTNIVKNNNSIANSADQIKKNIGESFSKAGIDLEQASGRIGSAVSEIDNSLKEMVGVSDLSGAAIAEYLAKGFSSTKNRAEIQLLIDDMELMKAKGQLTGDDLIKSYGSAAKAAGEYAKTNSDGYQTQIDLLNKQKQAAEQAYKTTGFEKYKVAVGEATLAIQKAKEEQEKAQQAASALAAAYETLGVTSTAALQDAAAKHKAAYDQIIAAGTESKDQADAAFLSWAKAEIQLAAATGKPVPAMLEAMAAARGLSSELNNLISTTDKHTAATANSETALASMGIKSSAVYKKMADDAEASYNVVANSATSTLEEQKAAFMTYAEASLKATNAAGQLPSPLLASQAAALGLSGSLEKLKSSLSSSGAAAEKAAQQYDVFDYRNNRAAEGAKNVVSTYQTMTPLFQAATIDMSKASSYMSMSVEDLNKEISKQDELIGKLRHTVGVIPDAFGQWIGSINKASIETYSFYQHAARASIVIQGLQKSLSERPSTELISQAEHALSKYKDLGDQNLSGLRSAIASAKSQMDSLNSSVQSTLNSLRDEFDEMNNNNVAIENRRYQTQVAELEDKLSQAQALKDKQAIADLKESLRLAQEIHNQKLATIKAEQDAAKKSSSAASSSETSTASPTSNATTSTKTITLQFGGKTATVQADSVNEAALDQILAQLEAASQLTIS